MGTGFALTGVNDHKSLALLTDTDGDRLSDFDEVRRWNSSPLHNDSDEDNITDDLDMFSLFSIEHGVTVVAATGELWQWYGSGQGYAQLLDSTNEWTEAIRSRGLQPGTQR